jgi:N utilization substance protein A
MVGQVLASEGFTSVEEVAYVDADEISSIDGFDEDTAAEIQARARDYLDKIEAEHDEQRRKLGVEDELRQIPGITTAMMVTLGEDGVKTIEDFAGYAVDDLVGWKERKDGETKFYPGVLADFGISRTEAEQMVVAARLKMGWISEDDLVADEEEEEPAEDTAEA